MGILDTVEKAEFNEFLRSIPWKALMLFLESRLFLKKKFIIGGYSLNKPNKTHFVDIVYTHGTNSDVGAIVKLWLWHDKGCDGILTAYFKSDEYVEYKKDKNLKEHQYVLGPDVFDKLLPSLTPVIAKILRLVRLIEFTEEQVSALESIEKSSSLAESAGISGEKPRGDGSNGNAEAVKKMAKEIKRLKELVKEHEARSGKVEKENAKLKKRVYEYLEKLANFKKIENEYELLYRSRLAERDEEIALLKSELQKLEQKLKKMACEVDSKTGCVANLAKKLKKVEEAQEEKFSRILAKVNWQELLNSHNVPDEVSERLNALIVCPVSDDGSEEQLNSTGVDEVLNHLSLKEIELCSEIMKMDVRYVSEGAFRANWGDLADQFYNVKCILSTKKFIISSMYEILRQYYVNDSGYPVTSNQSPRIQ